MAEVFSPHSKGQRRVAFTLAEVLITLGIIGVVAAITMPTLIQNYKKTVYVNQLKKSVSTLEQGFQKMMADDGVTRLIDTELFSRLATVNHSTCPNGSEECDVFLDDFAKHFKVEKKALGSNYTVKSFSGASSISLSDYSFVFNDGSILVSYYFSDGSTDVSGNLLIDVNGLNGPNIVGRDVFSFDTEGAKLIPTHKDEWRENRYYCGIPGNSNSVRDSDGSACAARIIENGWVMDY